MSGNAPRVFRSRGSDYQSVVAMLMLMVLAVLAGVGLLAGDSSDPAEPFPWTLLLGLVAAIWLVAAATAAICSSQRVEIGADGSIGVRGLSTGLRWRRFHAAEVDAVDYRNWQHIRRSVVSEITLRLKSRPGRRWQQVRIMNTHIADGGQLSLFRSLAGLIQNARPDVVLPDALFASAPTEAPHPTP